MLAGLRALREWLLRRNRRPRHALGPRIPWPSWWVLVGILRQCRSAPARPSVALCPAGDLLGFGPQIDGALPKSSLPPTLARTLSPLPTSPFSAPKRSPARTAPDRRRSRGRVHGQSFGRQPAYADGLADLGIAPVVTVPPRGYTRRAVRHRFKRHRDQRPRRSATGVTARPLCRDTRRPRDALRSASPFTRTPRARPAEPAPAYRTP